MLRTAFIVVAVSAVTFGIRVFEKSAHAADLHADAGKPGSVFETFPEAGQLKVATYNVLNLFDAEHDEDKDDFTFLPKNYPGKNEYCHQLTVAAYKKECLETDWSPEMVELKLGQIKEVFSYQGALPDLLAVEEIENEKVTAGLARVLGFDHYEVTNSPDKRGIDVALLYQDRMLEFVDRHEIVLDNVGTKATRNILRVDFNVKNAQKSRLTVYVNHWPSQAAPATVRMAVAEVLKAEIQSYVKDKANHYVVVLGDFNTLPEETPNGFHNGLQDPKWEMSMLDAQDLSNLSKNPARNKMPFNSYFYPPNNRWEKLDRILLSRNFMDKKGPEVLPKTFRIIADGRTMEPMTINAPGTFNHGAKQPLVSKRYDTTAKEKSKAGYSDHLPLTLILQF